jgi:hypothetical protein
MFCNSNENIAFRSALNKTDNRRVPSDKSTARLVVIVEQKSVVIERQERGHINAEMYEYQNLRHGVFKIVKLHQLFVVCKHLQGIEVIQ